MLCHQTKNRQNAGFTLVELMVVILIISLLILLGNFGILSQRREKARMEEVAVQIIGMIDQEKTNTLLGKTEGGAIVRKRKITMNFSSNILTYNSYADLAEDEEGSYCSISTNCTGTPPYASGQNTPLTTKTWQFSDPVLSAGFYNCDNGTASPVGTPLTVELDGDTLNFTTHSGVKHMVLRVSRDNAFWEIHIDRRTGVTYEKEGTSSTPSCS